ncbi:hypothetical protein C1646_750169 [Rhizophagus diaphanus]|nr:hypothetical protein C1646_750169 [Rhizophagus diaphanus] [Rhizophagus sp. MUCL 43196]
MTKKKKSKLTQCSSKVETDSSAIAGSIYKQNCKHIQILHYIHFINISDKHDIHFTGNFCCQFTNDFLHMNNATSTSLIMLFCLIKGEKPDKAFKVIIKKDKDVSDLKKVIKDEIPNDFAGIDAKNLTLWKVNVPASDKSKFERLATFIPYNSAVEEVLLGEKIENATEEVGKVFNYSLEKECIHIIIEPPATTEGIKVEEDVNSINKEDVSKGIANDRPTQNCEKQGFVTRYYSIPSQTSQTGLPLSAMYSASTFDTIIACLPSKSKEILYKNGIIILTPISKLNYTAFCKVLSIEYVHYTFFFRPKHLSSYNNVCILSEELFKMFMEQITSLKELYFFDFSNTTLTSYSGAKIYISDSNGYNDNSINLSIANFCTKIRKLSTGFKYYELDTLKLEALEMVMKYSYDNLCEIILSYKSDVRSSLLPEEFESFLIYWKNCVSRKSLSLIIVNLDYKSLDENVENMKLID